MDKRTELIRDYSSAFLEIIDNVDDFSRGDLQWAIEAELSKLIAEVEENLNVDEWLEIGVFFSACCLFYSCLMRLFLTIYFRTILKNT